MNKKKYIQPTIAFCISLELDQLMIEATSGDSTSEQLSKEREDEDILEESLLYGSGSWYLW